MIKVSLFCSANRPKLWPSLLKSLENTSVKWEVVFVGPFKSEDLPQEILSYEMNGSLTLIETGNIKPAQCYEIARRNCLGETVVWIADDCEFPNDVIGKAYEYWKSKNNEKLILSIQTKESGYNLPQGQLFDMKQHCFFGMCPDTPLMAPLAMMSRSFLQELGGIDQRYLCGQYENSLVMRAYTKDATVEIFGGPDCYIDIDHLGKSILIGESKVEEDFLNRPFAKGYQQDRRILEESWCKFNVHKLENLMRSGKAQTHQSAVYDISHFQLDEFHPYPENIPLDKSISNKGVWE